MSKINSQFKDTKKNSFLKKNVVVSNKEKGIDKIKNDIPFSLKIIEIPKSESNDLKSTDISLKNLSKSNINKTNFNKNTNNKPYNSISNRNKNHKFSEPIDLKSKSTHKRNLSVNTNGNKIIRENENLRPNSHRMTELDLMYSGSKGINTNSNAISTCSKTYPNNSKQDPVQRCLQDSLKIIERLKLNFEKSSENNKESLKNLLITSISLSNKNEEIYTLTNVEKELIHNHIITSSDQRLKNYSNLFDIINTSLLEMKDCLNSSSSPINMNISGINNICQDSKFKKPKVINRYSMNEQELNKFKLKYDISVIPEHSVENLNTENNVLIDTDEEQYIGNSDESCDFSESLMLENASVLLPKLIDIQLTSLKLKELIRRETKEQKFNPEKTISKKVSVKKNQYQTDIIKENLNDDDFKYKTNIEYNTKYSEGSNHDSIKINKNDDNHFYFEGTPIKKANEKETQNMISMSNSNQVLSTNENTNINTCTDLNTSDTSKHSNCIIH